MTPREALLRHAVATAAEWMADLPRLGMSLDEETFATMFVVGFDIGVNVALHRPGLAMETQQPLDPIEQEHIADVIRALSGARP